MKRLFPILVLALSAPAMAQEATPTSTPTSTATPKLKATATPSPSPSPSPSPVATVSASTAAALRKSQSLIDSMTRETSHRIEEARDIYARGFFDDDLKPEIGRELDRGVEKVTAQMARVTAAGARVQSDGEKRLDDLMEELEELSEIGEDSAEDIANVRTQGGDTEENLQRIATEIRSIGEKADRLRDEAEELYEQYQERRAMADAEAMMRENDDDDHRGPSVHVKIGDKEFDVDGGDMTAYGKDVHVPKGETVSDVVVYGGKVDIDGTVDGDVVSFGGNVRVGPTGRVRGDAATFGGHVTVEDGGRVDGEIISPGPGAIPGIFSHGRSRHDAPWPVVLGGRLLWAGVMFITFFVIGLLILAGLPERTDKVARAIETSPLKVGGFGIVVLIALLMVSALLAVTIIGLVPLFFLVLPASIAAMVFGYVSLSLAIGRKLPSGIVPTPLALFTIGAVVIAAVNLLPWYLAFPIWFVGLCFATGAVVLTRFGGDEKAPPPSTTPAEQVG